MPAVTSETFLLIPATVTDLDDFGAHPDTHLVSVRDEPARAARLWHDRATRNPTGGDGLVQLSHHGVALIEPSLWDDVDGVWRALLDVTEAFLAHPGPHRRRAEETFPGQPAPIRLEQKGHATLITVGDRTTAVDATTFVPGLLDAAIAWFTWLDDHVGGDAGHLLARARGLRATL